WIRINVLDVEQSAGTDKNSRYWPKQDRLMDQSSDSHRICGVRDFRKPSRVPLLVAPGTTNEEDDVIVVLSSRPAYTGCAPAIDTRRISGGMPTRTGTIAHPSPPETTKSHCSRT